MMTVDTEKQIQAEVAAIVREVAAAYQVFLAVATKGQERLRKLEAKAIVAETRPGSGVGVAPPRTWSSVKN